jgi:hypothetical protein
MKVESGPNSSAAGELGFLRSEVSRQLAAYRRRRRRDKRKAFALKMATVLLSATITVLLGLRPADPWRERLSAVALVCGALITVLASAEAFFNHQDLWILRTRTVRQLEQLDRQLAYNGASPNDPLNTTLANRYLVQLEEILADDQEAWLHLRTADTVHKPTPGQQAAFGGKADPHHYPPSDSSRMSRSVDLPNIQGTSSDLPNEEGG